MARSPETLRTFVPELAVSWDVDAHDSYRQELEGSLVLADLSGFTALSERLARLGRQGVEELTDIIDRLFSTLIAAADEYGGQMLSFGGDALLLLFTGEGHPQRSGVMAHLIRSHVRTVGDQQTDVGSVRLRVRVGVHSGMFHAMFVGGLHRMLVLGGADVSATVSAEVAAQSDEIVVSDSTAQLLADHVFLRQDGLYVLQGAPIVDALPVPKLGGVPSSIDLALPPAVRDHLASSVDLLEHRSAAVGFVRVEDLDRRFARDADGTAQLIAEVVDTVQRSCHRFDVCVLASDVDRDAFKVVLTSGVPISVGEDAERMLLAARAIIEAKPVLPVRIGLSLGPVFAGVVGSDRRRTYTIMGDAVNLAARLMASAPPGHIRAAASVLDRSRAEFSCTPIEPFSVKGKRDLVHAVDVGRRREDRNGPSRDMIEEAFGREAELAVLMQAWHTATEDSKTQFVELVGDPGIGKTTIVEHFVAETRPSRHLRLRGDLYTRATPYRGLASLLSMAGDMELGPSSNEQLAAHAERLPIELRERLSLLNDVLGTTLPENAATTALVDDARRRTLATLTTELLKSMLPGPTLLELEDTHWFDDATAEWLTSVAAAPPGAPWCVVTTRRPMATGFQLAPRRGSSVPVQPLGDQAAAALIRAERGDNNTPPELVRGLSRRAAGNPLYLRELVRAMRGSGELDDLPDSLEALLTVRLDSLMPADRHLVCRASVLGLRFERELLGWVLDKSVARPDQDVLERIEDFLGSAPDGRIGFSHALIRETAYGLLPFRLRRELHARVAGELSRAGGADLGVLSFHYFAAQDWPNAWSSARSAADAALASHTPVEAAALLSRALDAGRRVPQLSASTLMSTGLELSRAYERSGQFESAERNYRNLARLPVGPLDRARMKVQLAWLAERKSNLPLAVRRARAAIRLLDQAEVHDRERDLCYAEARTVEGMALEVMGRHTLAASVLQESSDIARRLGAKRAEAQAASILDWSLAMSGRLDEPTNLRRALELYRSIGDVPGEAACLTNLGAVAYLSGQWGTAVDYYRAGQDAHTRSGDETSAALGAANTAEVLSDQGYWAESRSLLEDALEVWRSTGHEHGVAYSMGLLGRTRCRDGSSAEGLALLQEARDRHRSLGAKDDAGQAWVWIAEGQVLAGEPDLGLRTLDAGADDGSVTARRVRATAVGLREAGLGIEGLSLVAEAARDDREFYEWVVASHTLAAIDRRSATQHLDACREVAMQLGVVRVALPRSPT